jgi:hypothetical protein
MAEERYIVGVIAERRKIDHPWQDHVWEPVAVLAGAPATPAWTSLEKGERFERFYIGATEMSLASTETANYRDNLVEGTPRLWVVVRAEGDTPLNLVTVTADPKEGEAHTETGTSIVATVPMPAEIAGVVAAFVDLHHVERPFIKRKRDRLSTEELSRRDRTQGPRGDRS